MPTFSRSLFTRLFLLCIFLTCSTLYAAERAKIKVEGVDGALQKNVLNHLSVYAQKDHPRLNLSRIKLLNQTALEEIKTALAPFGYYQPQVKISVESLEKPAADDTEESADTPTEQPLWAVTYSIELGEPIKISTVDVQILGAGQEDETLQARVKSFPLVVGSVLVHSQYESGKASLLRQAQERGYFKATLTRKEIRVEAEEGKASLHLHLDTGERYRFGEIKFVQDTFDERFLRRYLNFKSGDFYDNKTLLNVRRDLSNSRYFSKVDIQAERFRPNLSLDIPVEVHLEPQEPNRYSASVGYGTDTGARGGLGWERRYRGRFGHFYKLDLTLAQKSSDFSALYGIPTGDPRTDSLSFKFGYKTENLDQKNSDLLLVGVTKTHLRNLFARHLRENLSLEYRHETYQLGTQAEVTSKLLVPGVNWSYLKADDPTYTRRGYRLSLGFKGAVKDMASDTSILQSQLKAAYIFPLGSKSRVLTRSELGFSYMPDFDEVPASMRFFAGGDKSVRGYDFDTLGPRDSSGNIIGGQHLFSASLEYTYRLFEQWDVAVFYDVGNAFDNKDFELKHGAGVGIHWISPIGPIRLDVAFALNDEDSGIRLHINMGPDL